MAFNLGTTIPQTYKLGTQQVVALYQGTNQVWPTTASLDGYLFIGDPNGNILGLSSLNTYLFGVPPLGIPPGNFVRSYVKDAQGNITASLGPDPVYGTAVPTSIDVTDDLRYITYFKDYTGYIQSPRFGSGLSTSEYSLHTVHLKTGSFLATAFTFCKSIKSISADYITTVPYGAFSNLNCPSTSSIYIDLMWMPRDGVSLGTGYSTGQYPSTLVNNDVFANISDNGTLTVPVEYSINNGGNPDGDITYLTTGSRNWTINYAFN